MSKGTVRFPESAIVDGRIGTSRITETIAGAAARLASADREPLQGALQKIARGIATQTGQTAQQVIAAWGAVDYSQALSPLERMQALGRLGTGRMNKTEAAYEHVLAARLHAGEILWYRFEAFKLRLADNTFYTPDFPVITATNELIFIEVKGRWTDKARAKTKIAAAQFPHRFLAIQRDGRHGWRVEDLTSRSW
ncbi:hypothetical protein [Paraburkholderia largidicola]|uniref:Uncharacterized protein n=1 Tax=Paraburkholderia largidicola TaxID=3014751 RepID=A0A7I8BJS6_9BURK|nr:hypothetical protein [Paraburkholderia sp. PGU16]BCF88693.1 hypothetical protein PPGU16_17600 [Paraburkholderia sp. PGU16]